MITSQNDTTPKQKRTQVKINFSNDFSIAVQRQIAAGVEHAFDFIGSSIKQPLYFRMNNNLKGSVLAQASRRNGAALIEVTDSFLKKPVDERIQVAFHELAHTKEWTLTTWAEWQKEVDEIIAFRSGEIGLLPQSKLNQRFEQAFLNAEVLVYYSGLDGKIEFDSGKDIECLERISPYMKGYNDLRDESSSELLAESLRFVAVNGFGKNKIADIVVREVLSW